MKTPPASANPSAPLAGRDPGRALQVDDLATLVLTLRIVETSEKTGLHLFHGDRDLIDHDEGVENRLRTHSQFVIRVPDLEHDGKRYRASVFSVRPDGSLEPWRHHDEGCTSPALVPPDSASASRDVLSFVVLAVELGGHKVLGNHYPVAYIPPMFTGGGGRG